MGRFALRNPLGAGDTVVHAVQATGAAVVQTVRAAPLPGGGSMVDVFSAAPGDVDTLRKLLIGTRNDATIWTGEAGGEERGVVGADVAAGHQGGGPGQPVHGQRRAGDHRRRNAARLPQGTRCAVLLGDLHGPGEPQADRPDPARDPG